MKTKPLLYACSGCSLAGCRAYLVAQELQARGVAEMSCLAGVAARKPTFMKQLEGRKIWVVDGCPIECARGVMDSVAPVDRHINLHAWGVKKNVPNEIPTEELVDRLLQES